MKQATKLAVKVTLVCNLAAPGGGAARARDGAHLAVGSAVKSCRPGTPKRRFLRDALALIASAAVLLLPLAACNSPFIPLPPPRDPMFTVLMIPDAPGGMRTVWETRGGPLAPAANARYSIFNKTLGAGVIARAGDDGSYVAIPFDGQAGDQIELQYRTPTGDDSQIICRILGPGPGTTACP